MDIKSLKSLWLWAGLACLAFFSASCTSTNKFYKDFTRQQTSLECQRDGVEKQKVPHFQVNILQPTVTDPSFTKPGSIRTTYTNTIPVLIYTAWNHTVEYRLGSANIRQDIPAFVRSALLTESERSGIFTADTIPAAGALTLEVEIDSLGARGSYYTKGTLIFMLVGYITKEEEGSTQARSHVRMRYTLRRGEEILREGVVSSHHTLEPFAVRNGPTKKIRADFNNRLVEGVSLSLKDNIERIVQDVNLYLRFAEP